jgi:hypothetical protein
MKNRVRVSSLLMAVFWGGVSVSAFLGGSPTASATTCPGGTVQDPITGICWSSNQPNIGAGNNSCLPGRLGLCLGALQNAPVPGAALKPNPPAGQAPSSWP